MKTTVGNEKNKGRVTAELLPISGEILISANFGATLDAHSAYVLGSALIRMAERIDAEHGPQFVTVTLPQRYTITNRYVRGVGA